MPTPTVSADTLLVEVHSASLNPIDNILRAGHLKDLFPITFPLSLVSEAYDHLADGHAVGKVIVTVK